MRDIVWGAGSVLVLTAGYVWWGVYEFRRKTRRNARAWMKGLHEGITNPCGRNKSDRSRDQ